jgi:hypothetical protein
VTPTGVTVPVAGESIAMTIMREYIAKPPDPRLDKAMMPQINLIKLTFINAAGSRNLQPFETAASGRIRSDNLTDAGRSLPHAFLACNAQ